MNSYLRIKKSVLIPPLIGVFVLLMIVWFLFPIYATMNKTASAISIYIDKDDTQDSIFVKVGSPKGWLLLHDIMDAKPRTGHYTIQPGESVIDVYRKLRNGLQTPINLTIPQVRTMDMLAGYLSKKLMLDSTSLSNAFRDTAFCSRIGYTPQTLPALFISNTYQIWWNTSLDKFIARMRKENSAFWNEERSELATKMKFTHEEVVTLASIVAEETAYVPEMPKVAGMYIRRLQIGMPLQADPTVKFALGDFSLRRIYFAHLRVKSPYNTYLNKGLPPGPIRIPSTKAIDAVLNYEKHKYLYMCAKEDFSGSHNFARTYSEHLANARRYSRALNRRGIK